MQHILIVEDEWVIYDGMAQFFKSKGFTVSKYTKSYEMAMASVREKRPDIALLDIELVGPINGIQVGKALKEMLQIPLIYISNLQDSVTRELALDTKPNGYFFKSKNAGNEELLTNVQLALQQASQQPPKEIEYMQVYTGFIQKMIEEHETTDIPLIKIALGDIFYFKTNSDNKAYLNIILDDNAYYKRTTIKKLETTAQLPNNFIKVNSSHIVNLFMVSEHKATQLTMFDGVIIKITRLNRKRVKDRFDSLFL